MTGPSSQWKRREEARGKRQTRSREGKRRDAFHARWEEGEVLARILVRKHGFNLDNARRLVARANPLTEMLGRRGQPPSNYELYEGVESTREGESGRLPTRRGIPFWKTFTKLWNGVNFERPDRQFVDIDGEPGWKTLKSTYLITKRRLEKLAVALAEKGTSRS